VLESRLAGWLAGDYADFRLWLDAPLEVRAERIADREDRESDQAKHDTRARENSEAKRYREYYDIDIADLSIYDISVNTARWDPEAVLEMLVAAIEAYDPAADEGKQAVTGVTYDF
jgi:cytidylate kinase